VLASLIGGLYVFAGPIVGAILFIGIKEVVVRMTDYWQLVMGLIVITIVLGFRGGVLGSILRWTDRSRDDAP
jgi:branched-chain amino acid transport system permease protein